MQVNTNTYLKFVELTELVSWSTYSLLGNKLLYTQKFPFVRIGDFLTRNKERVAIQDEILYKRPTIRINGGGISLRNEAYGKSIGTKNQFRIHKGQFLLSKIDARNGAFGVVPKELEGGIITGNFWTFDVNYDLINPFYLTFLTGTKKFQDLSQTASVGTTNRNYLQEDLFLNFQIPLPSLAEQEEIVNKYYGKIAQAEQLQKEAENLEEEIEKYFLEELGIVKEKGEIFQRAFKIVEYRDLNRWDAKSNEELTSNFRVGKIGDYIERIATGTTPPTKIAEYFNGDINFYTPADLGETMLLNSASRKISELAIQDNKARVFNKGDLLFVGIGSTVGKIGIVNNNYAASNQQITGFNIDNTVLKNEYVYFYFYYFKNITTKEKTKATLPIVNQSKIVNIPIPIPPISKQEEIISHIKIIKEDIKNKIKQSEELILQAKQEFEQSIFN